MRIPKTVRIAAPSVRLVNTSDRLRRKSTLSSSTAPRSDFRGSRCSFTYPVVPTGNDAGLRLCTTNNLHPDACQTMVGHKVVFSRGKKWFPRKLHLVTRDRSLREIRLDNWTKNVSDTRENGRKNFRNKNCVQFHTLLFIILVLIQCWKKVQKKDDNVASGNTSAEGRSNFHNILPPLTHRVNSLLRWNPQWAKSQSC